MTEKSFDYFHSKTIKQTNILLFIIRKKREENKNVINIDIFFSTFHFIMTENKCKSLENLLPIATAKLLPRQSPIHSMNIALTTSKSTAYSSIRDGNKSNLTLDSNDILHLRSKNLPVSNSIKLNEKKSKIKNRIIPIESEFSLIEPQQRNEWNIKAQEGIIKYRLPDGLPDGLALHTKLEQLMKTDTIYLNDRHFWRKLENRFQKLRKVSLYILFHFLLLHNFIGESSTKYGTFTSNSTTI